MNFRSAKADPQPLPVKILKDTTTDQFRIEIQVNKVPTIFRGCDIGPCVKKWSPDYLKTVNPEKEIKVHKSLRPQLDFRNKNFSYETITFRQLIENCEDVNVCTCENTEVKESKDLELSGVTGKYFWYLRSLGVDPRGKDISDLSIHFPELYSDLKIPQVFEPDDFFSSVFRITSAELQLWTHYDTCDNILIQVRGRKRIIFFPPSEALNLYLDGDKSEVLDVDSPDVKLFPNFVSIQRYEAILEEGDIVFIPALWFHNVKALNFSVSVNVFWKNLEKDLYDKKGFATLNKAVLQLSKLPAEYKDFYLRRMIIQLQKKLDS